MSSFSGLSTALSGLMAQRRAVEVTGANVANAATPGYTRQRVEMSPSGGVALPSVHAVPQVVGRGVEVTGVQRLSDGFLNARARTEAGVLAAYTEDAAALGRLEQLLAEPGDTGLSAQLAQFWSSWSTVANTPDSLAARSELLQRGHTLVQTLADTGAAVGSQWASGREQAGAMAAELTTAAAAVADLNAAVRAATLAGSSPNELLDRRDVLVNRIVELTGAEVRAGQHGGVDLLVGGVELVTGVLARGVQVTGAATAAAATADPVRLSIDGAPAVPASGTTAAVLTTLNRHLPEAAARFDAVAASLASSVNGVHAGGAGLPPASRSGLAFFTGSTTADLAVALGNPADVAAAPAGGGALSGAQADLMATWATRGDGPDAAWRALVVDLGVAGQSATRRAGIQEVVSRQASAAREAMSGVSIDEEMTQLVAYQRAYEGAARMISAVDEMLDVLVNRTGVVGR